MPLEYRQTFRRRRKTYNHLGGENSSKLFLGTERRAQMKECAMGSKEAVMAGTQGQTREIPRDFTQPGARWECDEDQMTWPDK